MRVAGSVSFFVGKTEVAAHIPQKTSRNAWSLQPSKAASPPGWYDA